MNSTERQVLQGFRRKILASRTRNLVAASRGLALTVEHRGHWFHSQAAARQWEARRLRTGKPAGNFRVLTTADMQDILDTPRQP